MDAALEVAGKITANDVPKEVGQCPLKKTLVDLNVEMKTFRETGSKFLVPSVIMDDMDIVAVMNDPWRVSVSVLGKSLHVVESVQVALASATPPEISPLMRFLVEGGIGMKLVAHCVSVQKMRQKEAGAEASVMKVFSESFELRSSGTM